MLTKMILAISSAVAVHQRQRLPVGRHRPRPAHPGPPRPRVHPADRDPPRREAPQDRRLLRHRRGHHDPRTTPRRPRPRRRLHPGHRRRITAAEPTASRAPPGRAGGPRRESQALDVAANADSKRDHAQRDGRRATAAAPQKAAKHHQACATPTTNTEWAHGGRTSVADGRLLCPHHHRRIHDPQYETRHLPGGKVSFHRRTSERLVASPRCQEPQPRVTCGPTDHRATDSCLDRFCPGPASGRAAWVRPAAGPPLPSRRAARLTVARAGSSDVPAPRPVARVQIRGQALGHVPGGWEMRSPERSSYGGDATTGQPRSTTSIPGRGEDQRW